MKSIRGKMLIWFGLPLFVLLTILGIVNYNQVRHTVIPLTEDLSKEILVARSAEIGRLIEGYINDVIIMSERNLIREGDMQKIKADLVARADSKNDDYEILFYTDREGDFVTTLGHEGNISDRDYYEAIISGEHSYYVGEPVVSRSTGELIFVVASAVYNEQGEKTGLMAATVLLKTLSGIAEAISIGESGFGYIVDHNALLIAHPNEELVMKLNFMDSEELGYVGLTEIGQKMSSGESDVLTYVRPNGSNLVTAFNPIPNTPDWALGISMYVDDLMGPAAGLMRSIIAIMVGIQIVVMLIVFMISRRITSPILNLKEGVKIVSSGNLEHTLNIDTGDELEVLARDFNKMKTDLKKYILNLQKTTAEKERIAGELEAANKIQTSMLPRLFPPYPDMTHLDLYATMEPAKEVGGDFYDFYLIDENKFSFCIGDVSGKGIPAALFMVITRTILKNQALKGSSLSEIFYQANNLLCSNNEENMFVSVFMGILDTSSGEMEYINAGHNPPLLSRARQDYEFLPVHKHLVLGAMDGFQYATQSTRLNPRDNIFIYTDGITEAANEQEELFGDNRMVETINKLKGKHVKEIIFGMRQELDRFVLDTPASDDVTMLTLTRNSGTGS